jgi:hypothetical protein
VCKDFAKVFVPPTPEERVEKYSLEEASRWTRDGDAYYQKIYWEAPEQFKAAMLYKFAMRKLPCVNHQEAFFINCAVFRGLLKDIFYNLLYSQGVKFEPMVALNVHNLVNIMSGPTLGIHPHSAVLWQEVGEKYGFNKPLRFLFE